MSSSTQVCLTHSTGRRLGTPDGTTPYKLFAPVNSTTTYLIDMDGKVVRTWVSNYEPATSVYLLDNGHVVRPGKFPGTRRLEEFDWDGNLLWYFDDFPADFVPHHDIEPMPNGNILVVASLKVPDLVAIAAGRDPASLAADYLKLDTILEVKPGASNTGEIVWSWSTFDHVIQDFDPKADKYGTVSDHPELLDINFDISQGGDFTHANSVAYNAELDQIMINFLSTNEFYIIDHSTTTDEAAGHSGGNYGRGGDFLYRWGNPQAYRQGSQDDQQCFGQHDSEWIPAGYPGAGNIILFNNGGDRPGGLPYSSVIEIVPPLLPDGTYAYAGGAYGPAAPVWAYVADPPESMFSGAMSGIHRQPNGNTLICVADQGQLLEVTPLGETVWDYMCPFPEKSGDKRVFKADRYYLFDPDFPMEP